MQNNINDILKKRRNLFFDRLQKIERINATCKIMQKDITDLFFENYEISKTETIVKLRHYLDLFQAELIKDKKNLKSKLDKINKQ